MYSALPHVFVMDTPEQVVQQPLAQGTIGAAHPFNLQRFEGGVQNGDAAEENRAPLLGQSFQADLADVAGSD